MNILISSIGKSYRKLWKEKLANINVVGVEPVLPPIPHTITVINNSRGLASTSAKQFRRGLLYLYNDFAWAPTPLESTKLESAEPASDVVVDAFSEKTLCADHVTLDNWGMQEEVVEW